MKILTTILLLTIILLSKPSFGQTESYFDSFICNEWYLYKCTFVNPEQEILSDVVNRDYKMVFYRDHKVTTNFSTKRQFGVWVYTPDTKILTITYNETNEIVTMKVFKLSQSNMILDYTDENGIQLSLWMSLHPNPIFID